MIQADNSNLAMGMAGLSHIFTCFKQTAPRTAPDSIAVMKPLKDRLVHKNGSHFMTDVVVIFLALLPWQYGQATRGAFMDKVKRLLLHVDPLCSDRSDRRNHIENLRRDFADFANTISQLPVLADNLCTPQAFERLWREDMLLEFPYLSQFALRLARTGISEAACERVFSKLKYVINPLRSRTAVKNVRDQLTINMIDGLALDKPLGLEQNLFYTEKVIASPFVEFAVKVWTTAVNNRTVVLPELPEEQEEEEVQPARGDDDVHEIDNPEVQVGARCRQCNSIRQDCKECPGAGGAACPQKAKFCEPCRNKNKHDFCFSCNRKNMRVQQN